MGIIIINASNINVGGGVQVALSFLQQIRKCEKNEYHVILSQVISEQILASEFSDNFNFYQNLPSNKILKFFQNWKYLKSLEKLIKPDLVFSIFGPTYWKPNCTHLMGVADGWIYNPGSVAFKYLPLLKRLRVNLLIAYKRRRIKKEAEYLVVETEVARKNIAEILSISASKIYVVGNSYGEIFDKEIILNNKYSTFFRSFEDKFKLVLISHNYTHKNLKIIQEIIPMIFDRNVVFFLTIDEKSYTSMFKGYENYVINLGPLKLSDCPFVYRSSDALFFPTLLETFSASYPEAMKMELPIITSNYSFAKEICNEAALYVDPLDPKDCARKILKLQQDDNLRNSLIKKGLLRLTEFESAASKASKYQNIIENLKYSKVK